MPIITDKRLILVHIPKTGGTSIEKAFSINSIEQLYSYDPIRYTSLDIKKCFTPTEIDNALYRTPQHLTAYQISKIVPSLWNTFEAVSIVRNPYDRLVSEWSYIQQHEVTMSKDYKNLSFKDFVLKSFQLPPFVTLQIFDAHLSPQKSFLTHPLTGSSMVTKVFRFEALEEVFKYLNINPKHQMKTNHIHFKEYYDKETQDIVYERYKEDFEYLNYSYEL